MTAEAEYQSRTVETPFSFRMSKSATTSPTTEMHGNGYFGISNARDDDDEPLHTEQRKITRRLSGPAWQMTPFEHHHSNNYHMHHDRHHPYHRPHSPSPQSSDSDGPHVPHYSSSLRTSATHTPSTSPFLGPLRSLQLHSADPSRAPSPTLMLPPPSIPHHSSALRLVAEVAVVLLPTVTTITIHQTHPHAYSHPPPSTPSTPDSSTSSLHTPITLAPLKIGDDEGEDIKKGEELPGFSLFEAAVRGEGGAW
ncbi:hypothetical protein CPB85DRAFT_1440793 [Mucidula mucida]|nr:hypothetical protein CPB85DRAFT_1440793 [Mucidula mucida]